MSTSTPAAARIARPAFIARQPLFLLKETDLDRRWQAVVNESEPNSKGDRLRPAFTPPQRAGAPDVDYDWKRLTRKRLLASAWLRVLLVCGAGLGKTTNLKWLEMAINRQATRGGRQFAFFIELEHLSASADELLEKFVVPIQNKCGQPLDEVRLLLNRLRAAGRITLLLDSLDQAGPEPNGKTVRALTELLNPGNLWENCPIWISGRPWAFHRGEKLFHNAIQGQPRGAGPSQEGGQTETGFAAWQVVRIGQLDEPETRFLLGKVETAAGSPEQKYRLLPEAAQRLARVPRTGRLIALLPPSRFGKLQNNTDVYWEVYTYQTCDGAGDCGLLADGLKTEKARRLGWHLPGEPRVSQDFRERQVRLACDLLGAIAFEMLAHPGGPVHATNGDYKAFRARVFDRYINAGVPCDQAYQQRPPPIASHERDALLAILGADWDCLLAMDSHGLKHFIFSTDARDQQLRWTDTTTMAFWAAYWACRRATKKEHKLTEEWVLDPLTDSNEEFREFWTFAAEMPEEALDPERWKALFAPLYGGSLPGKIRSTEFICRTWERMRGTDAQAKYLAGFAAILAGDDEEKKQIAAKMLELAGFIELVGTSKPGDNGTFQMGDEDSPNACRTMTLERYRLHKYCLSNVEFELFDERHKDHRWLGKHPSVEELLKSADGEKVKRAEEADDDCPVVNVSWYDAWCFAKWLGRALEGYEIGLPREVQWEYACRAGQQTPFTFHAGHDGMTCTADVCNFDGNHPYGDGAPKGEYRQRTLPVDGLEWDARNGRWEKKRALGPNRWDFHQMHGNVWEWCEDWYDEGASARVLRGGCWSLNGDLCRSACRSRREPDDRYRIYGFRLAAVPVLEPSRSQGTGASVAEARRRSGAEPEVPERSLLPQRA